MKRAELKSIIKEEIQSELIKQNDKLKQNNDLLELRRLKKNLFSALNNISKELSL